MGIILCRIYSLSSTVVEKMSNDKTTKQPPTSDTCIEQFRSFPLKIQFSLIKTWK